MTPFQLHVEGWKGCTRCPLHLTRRRVVLARGTVPARLLLIGEAPGESENALGLPFVGPAGHLLDQILRRALAGKPGLASAITNVVCCVPRAPEGGKLEEPPDESVEACHPRLAEFVKLCDPEVIVAVGKVAEDWLRPGYKHTLEFHKPLVVDRQKLQPVKCPDCGGTGQMTRLCDDGDGCVDQFEDNCNRCDGAGWAETHTGGVSILFAAVRHPAFILRMPDAARWLEVQRAVVTIRDAVEDL